MTETQVSLAPRRTRSAALLYTPAGERRFPLDAQLADLSMALGAVSIVAFWSFGIGALLGLAAVVTGALSTRADRPQLRDAAIGIATGAVGVVVGVSFLVAVLPNF